MIKRLSILVLCLMSWQQIQAQEYNLYWRMEKGLRNIFRQTFKVERIRYVSTEMQPKHKVFHIRAETSADIYWKVENIFRQHQVIISVKFKNGMLKLWKNGHRYLINTHNAAHCQRLKQSPTLRPFRTMLMDGFAFMLDIKNIKVMVTWKLVQNARGKYERSVIQGRQDPLGLENSYRLLPNKKVPLGYAWDRKYQQGAFTNAMHYQFDKVTRYKGRKVAHILFFGDIIYKKQKVGEKKGYLYYDYQRHLMIYQQSQTEKKINFQVGRGEKQQCFEEHSTNMVKTTLISTTAR